MLVYDLCVRRVYTCVFVRGAGALAEREITSGFEWAWQRSLKVHPVVFVNTDTIPYLCGKRMNAN